VRASVDEIARRLELTPEHVQKLLGSAKKKMYAARLKRPTPYVDKTVYAGWNALCISAYLDAAKALGLDSARQFALHSLDRVLSKGWRPDRGLLHVIAYSDPQSQAREIAGVLDDYAFTAIACLDAYEATADLSYFKFARQIADAMVDRFFDPVSSGFFDTDQTTTSDTKVLGVLGARRKPFQDSPTPAGNSVAAVALLRLHAYTNEAGYRNKAQQTMEVFAGMAGQYGIFGATYGIAAVHFSRPHTQVAIIGDDHVAAELYSAASAPFAFNKSVIKLKANQAVPQNLAPALAETIPHLPGIASGESTAVICSGFTCQPPVSEVKGLKSALEDLRRQ